MPSTKNSAGKNTIFKWHGAHSVCFMHICALVYSFTRKRPNKCFAFVNKFDCLTKQTQLTNAQIMKIREIISKTLKKRCKKMGVKLMNRGQKRVQIRSIKNFWLKTKLYISQWRNNNHTLVACPCRIGSEQRRNGKATTIFYLLRFAWPKTKLSNDVY